MNNQFMKLDEKNINVNYQPTPQEYEKAMAEYKLEINYARMLDKKVAIITGASYGIGYEIARVYAQHGARLIIVSRTLSKLDAAAEKIRKEFPDADIRTFAADVANKEKTYELFDMVKKEYGRLDILVNNAATGGQWRAETFTDEVLDFNLELNLKGPMRYCREALKIMLPQHYGRVINVGSVNSVRPLCGSVYAAAKGGLENFTLQAAIRCVGTGVTFNSLCPGFTLTPLAMGTVNGTQTPPEFDQVDIVKTRSQRNVPTFAINQAHLALFLGSDMAEAIQGQTIVCDNGQYL